MEFLHFLKINGSEFYLLLLMECEIVERVLMASLRFKGVRFSG